jgi:hypothetical protein
MPLNIRRADLLSRLLTMNVNYQRLQPPFADNVLTLGLVA